MQDHEHMFDKAPDGPAAALEIRHALEPERVDQLLELYGQAWWASDRTADDVRAMLEETDLVFALVDREADRLAGFARVLTDGVYRAFVYDVVVDARYRDRGLGRTLMDAVVAHPRLGRVELIELSCQPELVPFYRRCGFEVATNASTLMRRARPS
jgi:GNAT superfamily N-acetyltransferase